MDAHLVMSRLSLGFLTVLVLVHSVTAVGLALARVEPAPTDGEFCQLPQPGPAFPGRLRSSPEDARLADRGITSLPLALEL